MFSRGSSSSMANNKAKEIIVEAEEEQDGINGSPWLVLTPELLEAQQALVWLKGKEIMVEAEEEQDGNNGSPSMLLPPELLEAKQAIEWLQSCNSSKGKEIIVEAEEEEEEEGNNGSPLLLQAEEAPQWLRVLLRSRFWEGCSLHWDDKRRRAEDSVFCVHCFKIICPYCRHDEDEPTHRLLKIRRYVLRSVVSARDMNSLGVDISYIQTYKCNGHKVVHLRPIRRSPNHRPAPKTPRCMICQCFLHTSPNRLCSLTCKHRIRREAAAPVNSSGRRPSIIRLGRPDAQGEAASRHPNAQGEAASRHPNAQGEAASRPASRRRRPRKMAIPCRAPFF